MARDKATYWNRSVVAMLLCVFCTSVGSLMLITALGVQVYELTNREFDLGLLGLAEFAPSALLVLITGSVADRFDRRRVSSIASVAQAASGVGFALYALSEPTSALPIFLIVLVFGVGRAFGAPSNRAMPADIVPAEVLPWLQARRSGTWQVATIIGPVIGGTLYAIRPVLPYLAVALVFIVAAISMSFVEVGRPGPMVATPDAGDPALEAATGHGVASRGGLREALEGLRLVRRSPILLAAISLDLFAVLFGGAVALLPAIATDRLGVDSVGLGWLRAAGGIGAALVTVAIAWRPIRHRVGPVLLTSVAIFGAATILLGITTTFAVAFVAMAVLSGADSVSVFIRSTLVPLVTPVDKRGRVLAVESVFIGASNELGAFESGVAGQLLGSSGAVVLGGAATLVVAGTYWIGFPALRSVDRFPESAETQS